MSKQQDYDHGPELAPQHAYPEVYHPPAPSDPTSPQPIPITPKREDSTYGAYTATAVDPSVYGGTVDHRSTYHAPAGQHVPQRSRKTICGCTFLVFILSIIIAVLAAAVIGLAAGTGVEASRANNALDQLAALQASGTTQASATVTVTAASSSATATGYASITNNCSNQDETTTGQNYTTDFFNKVTFTMFCNTNAPNAPLMSLFTANFDNCMDACASFTSSEKGFNGNATCEGVSFIPLWTTRSGAVAGKAPGNCYLKPGPQNRTSLETPNIGTECHAAILNSS
ncbi:hypothetical protein CkaCkLH20_12145 [Colletotrichum karsti]|uniref:Uncharacterized protein n=1 Tax=Colletotrichum karsti TaxID=1095194 RepID=A0A9P6LED9_9PEZI|nr:uncharacterized protein CkaCkLH20_12145 [Colletotrichum karsti]KAF9870298.1 hypothetical protein CkaCkLH20_12145 [Colletotrichum karsti]